ncbi:Tad domain-containing protein [Bacillus marinisedimentorum]|uniref:Tad domain-containing protein n=1 Tax=Bacillus marinisedimentorum TaxID=1821260 RepID=UPI000872F76E|nr:Tad domain-containing protein [Bacillus marinisedimentorum]
MNRLRIQDEKGNITIFFISSLFIMVIMFLIVLNFTKVFAVKQQASNAAEQASFAATAVIYELAMEGTRNYDRSIPGQAERVLTGKTVEEKIGDRADHLQRSEPNISFNEARIRAIDEVLSAELQSGPGKNKLNHEIVSVLQWRGIDEVRSAVSGIISSNGGGSDVTSVILFSPDYRVEVETSSEFEALKINRLFTGMKKNLFQTGKGPEAAFLKEIDGWSTKTIQIP